MDDTTAIKDLSSFDQIMSPGKRSSEPEEASSPKRSCNHGEGSVKVTALMCSNCGTTKTPLWRRAPDGTIMCNACGLYLKTRSSLRPSWLKKPETLESPSNDCEGTCKGSGQCNGTGGSASCGGCPVYNQSHQAKRETVCSNCGSTTTPLWRRDDEGKTICNACGLYYKLHKVHRPVSLKKSVIKRRKRLLVGNKRINTFPSSETPANSKNPDSQRLEHISSNRKSSTDLSSIPIKPHQRSNQPIFKVKRNPNPIVLSKPLNGEVPAIEDYLGPQKKKPVNSNDVDHNALAKMTIEEDKEGHYVPVKSHPAPISTRHNYPTNPSQLQTSPSAVSSNIPSSLSKFSIQPPQHSYPQPPQNHRSESISPRFNNTSLPPLVNPNYSSSSSSSIPYQSPNSIQSTQKFTLPSIREVYPNFPHHINNPQPHLISSPSIEPQKNMESLDRDALAAHKRELQVQMANLSQMLQSTSALLNGIDKALSSDR